MKIKKILINISLGLVGLTILSITIIKIENFNLFKKDVQEAGIIVNGEVTVHGVLNLNNKPVLVDVKGEALNKLTDNKYRQLIIVSVTAPIQGVTIESRNSDIQIERSNLTNEEVEKYKNLPPDSLEMYLISFFTNVVIDIKDLNINVY